MRIFKQSIVYMVIVYTLIYILLIAFISYDNKQTTYDMLSNQLYFDNILIASNAQRINWERKQYKGEYRVYIEINEYCRVAMFEMSDWTPPMIWGHYPHNIKNSLKAVVGKNINDNQVIEENGIKWIECFQQKFEVVGVVGAEYITSCDNLIILFGVEFDKQSLEKNNCNRYKRFKIHRYYSK